MDQINITYRDVVSDVAEQLANYLTPLDLTFYFGEEPLYIAEVCAPFGGLSLFLFNKQEKINEIVENLTSKRRDGQSYEVKMLAVEKEDNTYFGFEFKFIHNLVENSYHLNDEMHHQVDYKAYWEFILELTKAMLEDKCLSVSKDNKKKIRLDELYEKMRATINDKELMIQPNSSIS